jgi:hypothetical protein
MIPEVVSDQLRQLPWRPSGFYFLATAGRGSVAEMNSSRRVLPLLLLSLVTLGADAPAPEKSGAPATQPTAEDLKQLEPGPRHELLKALVGQFDGEYEIFTAPDAKAQRSKGRITNELVYGGRFLRGRFDGEMLGKRFTGENLIGYDNISKHYVTTSVNDGGTAITFATGDADAAGKVITMECEEQGAPADAEPVRTRLITTLIDNDHYRSETFVIIPGLKPFTAARITYTRR